MNIFSVKMFIDMHRNIIIMHENSLLGMRLLCMKCYARNWNCSCTNHDRLLSILQSFHLVLFLFWFSGTWVSLNGRAIPWKSGTRYSHQNVSRGPQSSQPARVKEKVTASLRSWRDWYVRYRIDACITMLRRAQPQCLLT